MQLPNGPFGPIPGSVTLNGSGNGTLTFQPNGKNARITNLFGRVAPVSPATTPTNQAVVNVYLGQVADSNRVFNNNSGSTGFSANGQIDVQDGQTLYVVWTGGDAGAIASATFSGTTIPFGQGDFGNGFFMEASEPIAAGDGSLIFPALKSPNYVVDSTGWKISRQGDVEFNNARFRGTIDIASGIVHISSTGIEVDNGTGHLYTINVTGGIRGEHDPDDGAYVALQDDGLFIHNADPDTVNGLSSTTATIQTDAVGAAGARFLNLGIYSPEWNTVTGRSVIKLWSKSDTAGSDNAIDLLTNNIRLSGVLTDFTSGSELYGKGYIGSPAIRTTDAIIPTTSPGIVLMTYTGITWEANRAYRVRVSAKYVGTGGLGGTQPLLVLRKGTTTAGAQVVENGRVDYSTASTNLKLWEGVFIIGGSNLARDICLCGSNSITNTVTMQGTGDNPAIMEVMDIGPASRYPGFPTLT